MSYVVLARKWRPQTFEDVLGQEHVTKTLTNAIAADRVAHAFLFSGPRGVGKTSAARILAKALCCLTEGRSNAEPCGSCQQCVEITEGRSTDIFEIDAASHTGVDNVREIIDNARYLPSSARFKIYVIDEVHMLTASAFNALLKTLEEPPAHVKFILATTDVHKVPVTVKSRCQRYDFRRIALSRIAERLSYILEQEGVAHDASALSLVARESEGSMRDAQSLLEQVLAFAGDRRLDAPLVRDALGVVDGALVARARDGLLNHDPGALIHLVGDVHERGLDLPRFVSALLEHVRDLLAAKLVKDPATVLDRPADEIEALVEAAQPIAPPTLERLFEQLCRVAEDVGRASHPRFVLEVGLASLAEQPAHVPVEQLVGQLDRVASLLGAPPKSPRGGGRGPAGRGPAGGGRPPGGSTGPSGSHRAAPGPTPGDAPRAPTRPRAPARPSAPDRGGEGSGTPEPPPGPPPAPSTSAPRAAPAPDPAPPPWADEPEPPLPDDPPPRLAEVPEPEPPSEPARPNAPAPVWADRDDAFSQFVARLRRDRPSLAATFVHVRPLAFAPGEVVLGCETAFDERKLEDKETQAAVRAQLEAFFGAPTRFEVRRRPEAVTEAPQTLTEVEDDHARQLRADKEARARENPAVHRVVRGLGGRIAKVRVLGGGSGEQP